MIFVKKTMSKTVDKLPIKEGEEWRDAALGENGCVNRIIRLLPDFMD